MTSNRRIWALQLVRYFVVSKQYLQMTVKTNFEQIDKRIEFWLVNSENDQYPIICITDQSDNERKMSESNDHLMYDKLLEMVGKIRGKVLNISLSDQATSYSIENAKYISLYPGCDVDESVLASFPEIATVICDIQEDPKSYEKMITNQINKASMAAIKTARKKALKQSLLDKTKLTTSFKVVSAICVVICVLVNLLAFVWKTDSINTAIALGAYYKSFVSVLHQYWRLLTAGFIHSSPLHLLCNLFALASLTKAVENYLGVKKSLAILLISIVIGNCCVFIGDKNIVGLGLSGGIYGLLGAVVVIAIQQGWFRSKRFTSEFYNTVMINIFISLLPNVSLLAHLGGFVAGFFLGYIFSSQTEKFTRNNYIACGFMIVAVIVFLMVKNANFTQFYYGTDCYVAAIYEKIGLKGYAQNILEKCYAYYQAIGG